MFKSPRFPENKFNSERFGLNSGTTGNVSVVKLKTSENKLELFVEQTA